MGLCIKYISIRKETMMPKKDVDYSALLESTITERARSVYKDILNTDFKALASAQKKKYKNLTQRELKSVIKQVHSAVNNIY